MDFGQQPRFRSYVVELDKIRGEVVDALSEREVVDERVRCILLFHGVLRCSRLLALTGDAELPVEWSVNMSGRNRRGAAEAARGHPSPDRTISESERIYVRSR